MGNQGNFRSQLGCLAILAILVLAVTYFAVASFNPLAVYGSESMLPKIVISLLGIFMAYQLVALLSSYALRKSVAMATGRPAEDAICAGCGLPLIQFAGSHGAPMPCPQCKRWWHYGPACYNRDMPQTKTSHLPTYLCPHCRSDESGNRDLFDDQAFVDLT